MRPFARNKHPSETASLALQQRRTVRLHWLLILAIIATATGWSAWQTNFSIPELIKGWRHSYDLARRMFPPDVEIIRSLGKPLVETLQMALIGTTVPIFLALPMAFLCATNTRRSVFLSNALRVLLNTLRTVPELLWAMLLVSAVGLGAFPGTLALILHATGGMGKLFYETIETVDPGIIEAMTATGAGRFHIVWFGIVPNILPGLMSVTLLVWDYNNRAATILGLVGAGGLGLVLTHAIQSFSYKEAMTCFVVIVLVLTIIDRISAFLRARVI